MRAVAWQTVACSGAFWLRQSRDPSVRTRNFHRGKSLQKDTRDLGARNEQPNSTRQKKHLDPLRQHCSESRQSWTQARHEVPSSSFACGERLDVSLP